MSWLSTTDNEDFSQAITEKSDFLFILVLEGHVYYEGAKRDEVITCKRATRKYNVF